MNTSRGSEWRRWDLHLHTPSSYDYKNKSITNQEIIDTLIENEISAVAITDHHFMDLEKITELTRISGDELTVFPGIEVRTDISGRENIHLLGIFPETANISLVWTGLQSLSLHPAEVRGKGNENVYVIFRDFCKTVHEHGGIVTIHAGTKSSSVENITNSLPHKEALKHELLKYYDVFEMGQIFDIQDYKKHVLPNIPKKPPMIMCSDNHNIDKYELKESCWIKADPTFNGLLQTLREPEDRVFVGNSPELLQRISERPSKYIKSIKFIKNPESTLEESWFDNINIELNPEMAAIIGNKGNGKSALSDSFGLVGNSKNYDFFSFLNDTKFCRKRGGNKANHFRVQLEWFSGDVSSLVSLGDQPEKTGVETLKYIPQKFFEQLCNEEDEAFQEELEKVIFDLVEEKSGKKNLQELIDFKSEPELKQIEALKLRLSAENRSIVELEKFNTKQEREKTLNRLNEKKRELKTIKDPDPVKKPDEGSSETMVILKKIEELQKNLSELRRERVTKEKRKSSLINKSTILGNIERKITNYKNDFDRFIEEIKIDLDQLEVDNLKATDLLTLDIKLESIRTTSDNWSTELIQLTNDLDPDKSESMPNEISTKEQELKSLQAELDEPFKDYQNYLKVKEEREEARQEIIGSDNKPDSMKFIEEHLRFISEDLSDKLDYQYEERLSICEEIFQKKEELKVIRETLFSPISHLIKDNEDLNMDYPITLEVSFKATSFDEKFLSMINQNAVGSFRGTEAGAQKLRTIREKYSLGDKKQFLDFLREMMENLEKDLRDGKEEAREDIHSQILISPGELYDFVFSLDYLEPYYELRLDNKSLSELSPGERGYLLLVFYLFIDKGDVPLIVDQPEENLDNQSVFQLLVPCIKKVKMRRQLIIVTHNPNIAVVCDSEQIIYAKIDKTENCKVTYTTGSIENPEINQKIVEILEGTMPAFNIRDFAYNVSRQK